MKENFLSNIQNVYINTINRFKNVFSKNNLIFSSIFLIIGLIIHLELMIREVYNPDTFSFGYFKIANEWEVSLGRWFLVILSELRFGLSTPVFSTFFSIVLMNISILFIIDLFDIKKIKNKILLALLLLSIPSFMGVLTYYYCSIDYTLSMLFAVLVPWCAFKIENAKVKVLLSSIFLTLSLGIYQSYIGVAFGLSIIYIIQKLFNNSIKNIAKSIILLIISIILGLILYTFCSKIALLLFDVEIPSFRGANTINIVTSIKNFPQSVHNSYVRFFGLFFKDNLVRNSFFHRELLNAIIMGLITIIILFKNIKQKNYKELLFQLLLLSLMPMIFNAILFIATETFTSIIMTHGMFMVFVLLIVLMDNFNIKFINFISTVSLVILILTYIISINATYVAFSLTKNQTLYLAEYILDEIKEIESFNENSKICITGMISPKTYPGKNPVFKMITTSLTEYGFFWQSSNYNGSAKKWKQIFSNYFGYDIYLCSTKEYMNIISSDDFKNMNSYPNKNCVKEINGIITVKLNSVLHR